MAANSAKTGVPGQPGDSPTARQSSHATASEVSVEVFIAGNGIDYPEPGRLVVVHYTAVVRPSSNVSPL